MAAGYTKDNYPEHVKIASGSFGIDALDNLYGGFEYKRVFAEKIIYKCGCGMFVTGEHVISNVNFMGESWSHENDNPVIRCPWRKGNCTQNDQRLREDNQNARCWCACHSTDEEYDYNNSFEKVKSDKAKLAEKKYQEYSDAHQGRICRNHMRWDEDLEEWGMRYDPEICASLKCTGQYVTQECKMICPILGRPLDKKRGNVFYDVVTKYKRCDLDGTLFEGQIDTCITRGKRAFKNPVSMDICRSYEKMCKEDLTNKVMLKYHTELFFSKYHGRYFEVEVQNIRAEQRESRDLLQDLEDIKNGVRISYESDVNKAEKNRKKERREEAKARRARKIEKVLLESGFKNMDPGDQNKARKYLTAERIEELEDERQRNIEQEKKKPVQLSLFDIPGGD